LSERTIRRVFTTESGLLNWNGDPAEKIKSWLFTIIANSLIESVSNPLKGVFVDRGRITDHTKVTRCLSRSRRVVAGAFTVVAVVAMRFGFSAASGLSELAWHWRLPML
jgi:hypothetical protein